jgi:hypothetical protein
MSEQICIDVARTADVAGLTLFLNRRGIAAVARPGRPRVDVPGDGVGMEQVLATVEEWLVLSELPFVPDRVGDTGVVVRPPGD